MKLCGSESALTVGGAIILVLFLIVCIFGIVNDGKNSCHNVEFPTVYDTSKWKSKEKEDASKTLVKCLTKAKLPNIANLVQGVTNTTHGTGVAAAMTAIAGSDSKVQDKVKECINESGSGSCVEGPGSMIFLVICIVLIVLVFGLLMWCTFGKNRVGGGELLSRY